MMAGRLKGKARQRQAMARWAERNDARLAAMAEKRTKKEKKTDAAVQPVEIPRSQWEDAARYE